MRHVRRRGGVMASGGSSGNPAAGDAPGASSARVELSLDLRGTPPDKVLSRVLGALERISDDVTLIVLLRDTPELASAATSIYGALRQRGYWSDSSRFPAGAQRLKIARRYGREAITTADASPSDSAGDGPPSGADPVYAPPPES